ncbi:hypothetical protein MBLNU230_g0152t1 [Neophaeotheca triangularis]
MPPAPKPTYLGNSASLPSQPDPFWHPCTPPRNKGGVKASTAAMPKATPPPGPSAKQRPTHHQARRPQCTHVTMNRVHGDNTCQSCGRVPSAGWLYRCMQDQRSPFESSELRGEDGADVEAPQQDDDLGLAAYMAEHLHMSKSVIEQIRAGAYTLDQIGKLIAQKEHLISVLEQAESAQGNVPSGPGPNTSVIASVGSTPPHRTGVPLMSGAMPMSPAGTPTNTPDQSENNTPMKPVPQTNTAAEQPKCSFQVCHTCRPYFQDRLYQSFEAVLYGPQPAITEEEIKSLPLLNPEVLRFIGLREPPRPVPMTSHVSQESMDIVYQLQGAHDNSDDSWTPSSGSSSDFDRENDESAQDSYPCPGAGICPLFSRQTGCAYDHGFSDGHRAINHGFQSVDLGIMQQSYQQTPQHTRQRLRRMGQSISDTPAGTSSTASSISLPTPITLPLTPTVSLEETFEGELSRKLKIGKAASVCGVLDRGDGSQRTFTFGRRGRRSSNSSLGSEVEVEGGVALTEEAVGGGMPDIVKEKGESEAPGPKV